MNHETWVVNNSVFLETLSESRTINIPSPKCAVFNYNAFAWCRLQFLSSDSRRVSRIAMRDRKCFHLFYQLSIVRRDTRDDASVVKSVNIDLDLGKLNDRIGEGITFCWQMWREPLNGSAWIKRQPEINRNQASASKLRYTISHYNRYQWKYLRIRSWKALNTRILVESRQIPSFWLIAHEGMTSEEALASFQLNSVFCTSFRFETFKAFVWQQTNNWKRKLIVINETFQAIKHNWITT